MTDKRERKRTDSVGRGLAILHVLFLICSIVLVGRIIYIQFIYEPGEKVCAALMPKSVRKVIIPSRGSILSDDGRLLAMSLPTYDIRMDCTVKKAAFAKNKERGDSLENDWRNKADSLAKGLSEILGDKSWEEYRSLILTGREQNNGYVRICNGIERREYNKIIKLPLFNEGKFGGGLIVEEESVRKYPYGTLARRTIGFVRNNKTTVKNTHVGIEGKYDYTLHGKDGEEYLREIDNKVRVHDSDSSYVKAEDGLDVRTTINIDFQDIADRALREQLDGQSEIEGGCLVLMEVATGAIKAMVNLSRDSVSRKMEESENFAVGRRCEPGSVFKTVTLVSVLSDGYIKSLDETIPTNHGIVKNASIKQDVHIADYERTHKTKEISILEGFKMSANYVFATLAIENYGEKPQQFIDNIYLYKLGEAYDLDIDGMRSPYIPSVGDKGLSNSTLGYMGFGYATEETPLHILTFYNAIANKGKLMKPYLVESIEKYGSIVEKKGPTVLNGSIFKKAVADTVTRALAAVTEEGTAKRLKNAKVNVAGKTGTSFAVLSPGTKEPYKDVWGRQKYQGTFVGFFPTENPKYSIICMIYSDPTHNSFQGGGIPAMAVKTVVDEIWTMESDSTLVKTGQVPQMKDSTRRRGAQVSLPAEGTVPNLMGMGLGDALYQIENAGYRCQYSGIGHVRSQSPKAGEKLGKGRIVNITLR